MVSEEAASESSLPDLPSPCDVSDIEVAPAAPQMSMEERFADISMQLKRGVQPQRETVRTLLNWAGVSRRGFNVSAEIRAKLDAVGLITEPDFEFQYIYGEISFVAGATSGESSGRDPSYRIGQLRQLTKGR